VIDAYLDHLRVERRLSTHTLESYARDLRGLAEFAAGTGRPVDALDRRELEAFVAEQRARGQSPRSVARAVASVRGYYRFLLLDQRLADNPAAARLAGAAEIPFARGGRSPDHAARCRDTAGTA
jgi:site-specific recombinase XerC